MGTEALWIPLVTAVAGSVVSSFLAPKPKDQAAQAAPTAPAEVKAAPQASQAPDVAQLTKTNATAASVQGPSSTLLTGIGGVPNSSLNLGKNTALGQ